MKPYEGSRNRPLSLAVGGLSGDPRLALGLFSAVGVAALGRAGYASGTWVKQACH